MIYYLTAIIIAINFLFSAPLSVHAAEETTSDDGSSGHSRGGSFSLQDALDGDPEAESQLRDIGVTFGQAVDASVRSLVIAPVKAAASSFMSAADDTIDSVVDALIGDTNFMSEIFINPFTKSFEWGPGAGRHGGGVASGFFEEEYSENEPSGFYKADSTSPIPDYGYFVSNQSDCYFTYCKDGNVAACCSSGASFSWQTRDSYFDQHSQWKFTYNGVEYVKNVKYTSLRSIYRYGNSQFPVMYPPVYDNPFQAFAAFYNFTPSSGTRPNGKGYIRALNNNVIASGNNVYNTDWNKVITNNYTTYGDTFNNTTVNNYYYQVSSPDTPNYWYDTYPTNSAPAIEGTYDDLENVTFSDPNLQTDNMFVSDLFGALPVAVSGFIVSLILLSVVVLFLRG